MLNRVIGEERYDRMRLFRRTNIARFYWTRQEILYETYLHYPEIANTIGIYPKTDLSHGFPSYSPYEMFRDFQENSINSDVGFGQLFAISKPGAFPPPSSRKTFE